MPGRQRRLKRALDDVDRGRDPERHALDKNGGVIPEFCRNGRRNPNAVRFWNVFSKKREASVKVRPRSCSLAKKGESV